MDGGLTRNFCISELTAEDVRRNYPETWMVSLSMHGGHEDTALYFLKSSADKGYSYLGLLVNKNTNSNALSQFLSRLNQAKRPDGNGYYHVDLGEYLSEPLLEVA